MICPRCGYENREDAKFCRECGSKLEIVCPHCNNVNQPGSKFCDQCGQSLDSISSTPSLDISLESKLEKIQRYLPEGLTEKILSQKGEIEGERKQVTVMFCDIEGFTSLSENLGSERIYTIMNDVFEILIREVHSYGGTVNKMTGDGIMALFGAPIALEDAPQRAIRAALEIQQDMTNFNNNIKKENGLQPLMLRIGIHTGSVVVGTLGNDLRIEFTAVGDTVNLASRMEGLAKPGTIYVTEDTFKLTEGRFQFEEVGERQIKGKKVPVKVYQVITPATTRMRFDVDSSRRLTPFVGREREFELLMSGFELAKNGRGQVYSIIGEAGVGKSRLLHELRNAVVKEGVAFFEGQCLSYGRNLAYHPLIDILKSYFNIRDDDEDNQIRKKVTKSLKEIAVNEDSTLPYLLELLSVKDSGINKIPMSGEARRDRMMEAWRRVLLKASELRPLIVTIEDLHWVDQSSEETLKYLLDSISGARILLILTYRPEFVHNWGTRSYHNQMNLNRLSNSESLELVNHIFDVPKIETNLQDLILEKTEGIPFFIEEFIGSLKDLGAIEKRDNVYHLVKDNRYMSIPSTIQDIIMARVDSLPDVAKKILQTGSVIEREFSYELVRSVAGIAEQELLASLSILKDAELVYEKGVYPQSVYVFKHALTREVVYDSILETRKKALHLEVGSAIEEIHRDNLSDYYEVLAGHYVTGEDYGKGAKYCQLAASKAQAIGSLGDAIAYGEKGLACLERLPRKEEVERNIIDIRTSLGIYYLHIGHLPEAREVVKPIVDLAVERNYRNRVSQIYTILGNCTLHLEEDYPKAFKYLEDALRIAEELGDIPSLVAVHQWLGLGLCFNCEFQKGLYHMEKALAINVAANILWGIASIKAFISTLVYANLGNRDLAYKIGGEAVSIAEESGDIFSKGVAYSCYGWCCMGKGFWEEAEESLLKGADFAERTNNHVGGIIANWCLADIYSYKSEYDKAQEYSQKALFSAERASHYLTNVVRIMSYKCRVMNNQRDINLNEVFKLYKENKTKWCEEYMARYIAEILLNIDDKHVDEAEEWIKKAIEADKRNNMMFGLGLSHAYYAEVLKKKNNLTGARDNLAKAIEIFQECGADGWVKKTEGELVKIHVEQT